MDFQILIKELKNYFQAGSNTIHASIGLDLEPTSLSWVEFSQNSKKMQLSQAEFTNLEGKILGNDQVFQEGGLTDAISKLQQKTKSKSQSVALLAPGSLVVSKEIPLNAHVPKHQWENVAWAEARKVFPGLANNLYLDFHVEEPKEEGKNKNRSMLLVASRKKELQPLLRSIRAAKLTPTILDVDYYALARAYRLIKGQLPEGHLQQHTAILNIDTNSMLMVVMHQGKMSYCHRQNYNGNDFVSLLTPLINGEQTDSLDQQDASSAVNKLIQYIQRFLQFYHSEAPRAGLDNLVLSGRCAILPFLEANVEALVNLPTTVANPFHNMHIAAHLDEQKIKTLAPAYMLASGLALRGVEGV